MESGTKRLKEKIRERLPVTGPQAASAYELVRWYCYHTNTHGCRRIVVSKGRLRRAAWVILTFGTVGIIFWQCALLIASYYTASVTITVQFQEITFPAVTICNINPYRYNATRHLFEKLDQATQIAIKELYHFMNSPNSSQARAQSEAIAEGQDDGLFQNIPLLRIELMDREYSIVSDLITKRRHRVNGTVKTQSFGTVNTQTRTKLVGFELCDKNNDKNSTCVIYTFNSGITAIQEWYHLHYLNIMAQVPQQTKLQMGYSADDLVFSCSFDGRPCDSRNFSLMHHPLHGNCFTFNGGENGSVLRTITGGSENGLKVTLHLDGNEYNPYLVTSMGAKIAIHDQHEQPFIEDVGIEIQTATETAMGLDMTVSQRLSSPYSDCTMDGLDVPVTNLYNKTYSLQMCLHSCFQMEMVRSCGCAHYEKPLPAEAEYCDYTKYPGWVACYYQLRDRFIQEQLVCQKICRPACHSKEWTMTISIAQWPSLPSEEWILRLLSWEKGLHGNRTLRKNELANLGIFYKDLNLRNISETAANNVVTLLSNFGGQLGLWMSCSVACIIEIVEVFFIDMFLIAARRGAQTARKWWRKEGEEPLTPRNAAHGTPVYIGDEDPPTFNSALQLPRPPVPGTLPCPPVPDTLLCTAAPDTLPRPPVPDMLPRPPVPDRLPRPPVPDTLPRPPCPRHASAPPLSQTRSCAPLSQTRSCTPLSQTRSCAPLSQTRSRAPLSQTRCRIPLSQTCCRIPLSQTRFHAPLSQTGFLAPLSQTGFLAPLSQTRFRAPLSQTRSCTPLSQTRSCAPLSQTRSCAPLSQTRFRIPLSQTCCRIPLSQTCSRAPLSQTRCPPLMKLCGYAVVSSQTQPLRSPAVIDCGVAWVFDNVI